MEAEGTNDSSLQRAGDVQEWNVHRDARSQPMRGGMGRVFSAGVSVAMLAVALGAYPSTHTELTRKPAGFGVLHSPPQISAISEALADDV